MLYRIDLQICATAYIRADSEEDAQNIANKFACGSLEVAETAAGGGNEYAITGRDFTDPALPAVSISPAMTIQGIWPGCSLEEAE
ncbi:MAG: hypothetical protein J2P55_00065 [Rhizobiales bacterium]|nr:hypothetical protein [Hyphomicrobiales bacterium]